MFFSYIKLYSNSMHKTNISEKLFYLLPLGVIINIIFSWQTSRFKSPDTLNYLAISQDLPQIKNSLFPLFYPLILKTFSLFTDNQFIIGKVICLISVLFIFYFSKIKDFYWKELWVIFTFAAFQNNYPYVLSESILLPILLLFIYTNYIYLNDKLSSNRFLFFNSLFLFLLFITKYNSLFLILPFPVFIVFLWKIKNKIQPKAYFQSMIIVGVSASLYLLLNFILTGHFTGDRSNILHEMTYKSYLSLSIPGTLICLDPYSFSLVKILYIPQLLYKYGFLWKLPYLINFIFLITFLILFIRMKNKKISNFSIFCILISFSFLIFSVISSYYVRIDSLGPRLSLIFYFVFFIAVIAFMKDNKLFIKDKSLLLIGILANFIYLVSIFINGFS